MAQSAIPAAVTAAAYAIAEHSKSVEELALVACIFTQLGDTIASLIAANELRESKAGDSGGDRQSSGDIEIPIG